MIGDRQEAAEASRTVTGWAAAGRLSNGGFAQPGEAVIMQVNLVPGEYTVQISTSPIFQVTQKTYAEILWMAYGGLNRRLISVVNGTSISGVCNGVNVRVFDQSAIGGGFGNEVYDVNITVAKGTRASTSQQPILEGFGGTSSPSVTVPPAASADENVPDNCGATAAFIAVSEVDAADAPISSDEISVTMMSNLNGTGVILKQLDFIGCNQWVPLAQGCKSITVTNHRAAGNIRKAVTFGIDG
jgi:hypothetical protein